MRKPAKGDRPGLLLCTNFLRQPAIATAKKKKYTPAACLPLWVKFVSPERWVATPDARYGGGRGGAQRPKSSPRLRRQLRIRPPAPCGAIRIQPKAYRDSPLNPKKTNRLRQPQRDHARASAEPPSLSAPRLVFFFAGCAFYSSPAAFPSTAVFGPENYVILWELGGDQGMPLVEPRHRPAVVKYEKKRAR